MSSSSGAEGTLMTSPHEHQANAPVAKTMDAKLMFATGSGDVQHLKDLVNNEEKDSNMMVVVMAKQQAASSNPQQVNMDPHLLALASSGSSKELESLLSRLPTRRASSCGDDTEANKSILEGITAEGDTALHVVAASGQGDNFFTRSREAKHLLVQKKHKWWSWHRCWCLSNAERHELLTTYGYGDSDNFLESARIIYGKAKHLLFVQNNKGDTPLHCAARAGKSKMAACLIEMAEGEHRMEELLRKENKHKQTALSEAVRVGNKDIVDLLIGKDSELASYPEDGGASPMYLAFEQRQYEIVEILYDKSSPGKLSFSGPNGQNALHAAVLRYPLRHRHQATDLTNLLKWNETHLCPQNKDLTTQRDENGSTPLHFAAAVKLSVCRQVLEANPDALYQPDHAGLFPIHVAASVGSFRNVNMFVTKFPGTAGLRDAKGRTFLHVAVEKKEVNVIRSACRNLSLSWIMNMVDNDGNTALHLAVEAKSIHMFCPLLWNPQVNLNLPNNRGETPLDVAEYKIPLVRLVLNNKDIEAQISSTLTAVGAVKGVHRQDHFLEDNKLVRVEANGESSKEMEVLKDSTGTLCIGSVLIATVTFGATFAVPGGYIADDHSNGGTPILAPRYAFRAFIMFNTLAFSYSMLATIFLMRSGDPLFTLWSRKTNLVLASYFVSISVTCLVAAFALAAYVVLVPVAQYLAALTCLATWSILLYNQVEFIGARLLLLKPLCRRKGLIRACGVSACAIMVAMTINYWPLMIIFGLTALQ